MTQKAIVKKIIDKNTAEIEVLRQSACGGDCEKCGGCGAETQKISAVAVNKIDAKIGDTVTIEGDTKKVLGTAVLVYILPLILFFAIYLVSYSISALSSFAPIFGCLGFFIGIGCAILYNNKLKQNNNIIYSIVKNH